MAAEDTVARADDGVGALDGPMHPGPLQARADLQPVSTTPAPTHRPAARNSAQRIRARLRSTHSADSSAFSLPAADRGAGSTTSARRPSSNAAQRAPAHASTRDGSPRWSSLETSQVLLGAPQVDDLHRVRERFLAQVPDQAAPSPSTTRRWARAKPLRSASRRTRCAKAEGCVPVSRLAALSSAAE